MVAYCDLETTTTPKLGFDVEQDEMFAVSYVIIFTFHPNLNHYRNIIERGFGHSLEQFADVSYMPRHML